jgi:hypothetical protein
MSVDFSIFAVNKEGDTKAFVSKSLTYFLKRKKHDRKLICYNA